MIKTADFYKTLIKNKIVQATGVPCTILKNILKVIEKGKGIEYINSVREDSALGIASGAYLAGKRTALFMQNSGLGNIINPLTSFNLIYKIPVLLFITWRGYKGKDAPEHIIMGRKTLSLLKELNIPVKVLSSPKQVDEAVKLMNKKKTPVAIIIKKGVIV
ncbi:MAG: thiamine pyrophosphate-binding protein [Armatimonadota bacterium]